MTLSDDALEYHSRGRPGKIEVNASKPCLTQRDLSLAYTPGVAEPCRRIAKNPEDVFRYTDKGNLVAVVSNGTAVLGLGNIGPEAAKPVMEGKGVLFKRFADIDVFDLEIKAENPDEFISVVEKLEPTFGGINLEDIKAPECFHIEKTLRERMNIPVFHDDQHGTAIISGAALVNAMDITGKKLSDVRVVVSGAGAAALACAKFYMDLGISRENLILVDSVGVIYKGRREGMNPFKEELASNTKARTLAEALQGADVFAGLSRGGLMDQAMVKSMGKDPLIMAMANPDPEILPEDALAARGDVLMSTGRSDYPNQVNNVLGFPFIFRGALDVRARKVTPEMEIAAARALAALAREHVPESVLTAYGLEELKFGPDYFIPKPLDPRVLLWVAPAVAQAAVDSGVAPPMQDLGSAYQDRLAGRMSRSLAFSRTLIHRGRGSGKRIVFTEGTSTRVLRATTQLREESVCLPVLLGDPGRIKQKAEEIGVSLEGVEIINPPEYERRGELAEAYYKKRRRRGITRTEAELTVERNPEYCGALMVDQGHADGLINGLTRRHPEALRPLLHVLDRREGVKTICGLFIVLTKNDVYFLADTTTNVDPGPQALAEIAMSAARTARYFHIEPRVAMLSFSNFGTVPHKKAEQIKEAVSLVRKIEPSLIIDGEMQADTAVNQELLDEFPFNRLKQPANVLVFPDLGSGNIAYKLLARLGGAEVIGPLTLGFQKPANVLHFSCSVNNVVSAAVVTAIAAREGAL